MKTCIGTYSYQQEFDKGSFTRFDVIDYTKKLGMDGVELVLHDDRIPEGYTFASYTKALADRAREIGLDVPMLTMSISFYKDDNEATLARLMKCVDAASEAGIPMMRHDICYGYRGDEPSKSPKFVIEEVASYIRRLAEYAESKNVRTCSENHGWLMQDPERLEALEIGAENLQRMIKDAAR